MYIQKIEILYIQKSGHKYKLEVVPGESPVNITTFNI